MVDDFYVMDWWTEPDDVYVTHFDAPRSVGFDYSLGRHMAIDGPVRLFHAGGKARRTDLLAGVHPFPVVSTRCRQLIEAERVDHIEFHPAYLVDSGTSAEEEGYWFLNLLDNVEVLDRARSRYELMPDDPDVVIAIRHLVLLPDAVRGRQLLRPAEMRSLVLVSDPLRRRMEAADLIGLTFRPVDEFDSER